METALPTKSQQKDAGWIFFIHARTTGWLFFTQPGISRATTRRPDAAWSLIFITETNEEQQLLVYWNRGFMKTGRLSMQKMISQDKAS
ncbi:MAG: hypothetical protein ACYC6S_08350 [Desulfobulbia bacterium]